MASVLSIVSTVLQVGIDLQIDAAELAAGALVKVGQVGSIQGKPVYIYLSESPDAV